MEEVKYEDFSRPGVVLQSRFSLRGGFSGGIEIWCYLASSSMSDNPVKDQHKYISISFTAQNQNAS